MSRGGIGLVHDWLTGQRGGEHVLAAIARLAPAAPIYTLFHLPGTVSAEIESHPIVTSFLQRAPLLREPLPPLPAALSGGDADRSTRPATGCCCRSSHCVAKGARRAPGSLPRLLLPHPDALRLGPAQGLLPGSERSRAAGCGERILDRLQAWDVATAGRVDLYLANSTFVAGRIRRYYGRSSEVLAPPVDTAFFRPAHEPREPFVLMVAALAPYKKVDVAIEACRRAGVPLVVVGEGPERAAPGAGRRSVDPLRRPGRAGGAPPPLLDRQLLSADRD